MPVVHSTLATELAEDPLALGYAPLIASGNDMGLVALLDSPTGPGAALVQEATLSKADFQLATMPAILALAGASLELRSKWDRILSVLQSVDTVRLAHPGVVALLGLAQSDGLLSPAQVAAIGVRMGSRTEVLFGAGSRVTATDISIALRGAH